MSRAAAWVALGVLSLVGFASSLDYQILNLLIEPLKRDLSLSDAQLGLLNGLIVALISAAAAFPIGWIADRTDRRTVLAVCVMVWSLATALCGAATSFLGLSAGALGISAGEAGLIPIVYAMIPMLFDVKARAGANAVIYAVLVLGSSGALAAGGALLAIIEAVKPLVPHLQGIASWRLVFVVAAAPGALLALALMTLVPRSRPDPGGATSGAESFVDFLKQHGLTVTAAFVAISIYFNGWVLLMMWSPAIMARSFGVGVAQAGVDVGTASLIGSVVGVGLSYLSTRWDRLSRAGPFAAMILGSLAAIVPLVVLWLATSLGLFLVALAIAFSCFTYATSMAPAVLQNCAPERFRSRVSGLFPITTILVRTVLPLAIGLLSDHWRADSRGLLNATCLVLIAILPVGAFMLAMVSKPFQILSEEHGI